MPGTVESKIEATHRLQREDRWNLASRYRDAQRLRLKAEGRTRAEAREEAWRLMIDRFRPLDESAGPWPRYVEYCPPVLRNAEVQPVFNVCWNWVWQVVSLVADEDAALRESLAGCNEESGERLWWLHQRLPLDELSQAREICLITDRIADKLMLPEASPLIRWAEPTLREALDRVEPELLDGEYATLSHLFLEKLVGAIPVLIESIQFFWPVEFLESRNAAAR